MEKRYFWLKLKEDFFDEKYIKALRKLPSGDSLVIVYLKMQLKCLQTSGLLTYDNVMPTLEEELSLILDEETNIVKITLVALENLGLIERRNDCSIFMVALPVGAIGSESSVSERVRKYRDRKKFEDNIKMLHCNGDVTKCNEDVTKCNTDIDIEKNIEKLKEIEEEIKSEQKEELEIMLCKLKNEKILSEIELKNYPYLELFKTYSRYLTYGSIYEITKNILEKIPVGFVSRYRQFEKQFKDEIAKENNYE